MKPTTAARAAFVIASAFFLFEFVVRIEPSLASGAIERVYGLNDSGFGTLSSLFFWVYAPMQIVVGLLLDRYGARRFVILGSFLCALGVLVFAVDGSVWLGGAGRILMGLGASFAFVAALWLVNHWFAPERFALLSGSVNAVGMLGTAIGGVALSAAIGQAGWRSVFVATSVFGLAIFVLAVLFLRDPQVTAPAPEDTGAVAHVRESLADVLGDGRTWGIALVGLLYYLPINVYGGLWGTTELIRDHHLPEVRAQTLVSLIFWGMAGGSIFGGWLSDRLGHRKYLVFSGAVLTALAYTVALFAPLPAWGEGAALLAGGFFGGLQMLTFAMAKEGQPNRRAGTVVAFVNMIGIAGALIFQPLVGYLADLGHGDLRLALATMPVCVGLAAVGVLFVSEYRHPEHRPGAHRLWRRAQRDLRQMLGQRNA
jgi:MFS family permease